MNGRTRALLGALALLVASFGGATPSHAARCGGDFGSFVQNMSAEAQGAGVSANVVSAALGGVQQDGAVLAFEQVTLFGLTLVEKRVVQFGKQDAATAHTVFVR